MTDTPEVLPMDLAKPIATGRGRTPSGDIGEMLNSPSTALMNLVDCDHQNDFDRVCEFLTKHAKEVVREVHGEGQPRHEGRLTIDNHRVMLNCPPAPESGDSHGHILIKTISEQSCELGITTKREFRVCDEGTKLHVREDICKGGDTMSHKEARVDKLYKDSPPPPAQVDDAPSDKEPEVIAAAVEDLEAENKTAAPAT